MSLPPVQPSSSASTPSGMPDASTRRRRSQGRRVWPSPARAAVTVSLGFTLLLYLVELVDVAVFDDALERHGIEPRAIDGLDGVVLAPLLHDDWAHLSSNTVPLLVLGFLAMAGGLRQFLAVTATIWLVGGVGVWLTAASNTLTVGASVLIFGWMTFLLVRGFFNRAALQIGLGVVLFLLWGGMLWGVLPGADGISWQGHLFGAVGGVLAAWLVATAPRRPAAVLLS